MAPERAGDVQSRRTEPAPSDRSGPCPFCPGQEHLNPAEIATASAGDGWEIRVTPDKRPLLRIEGDPERRGAGMFDEMNAIGAHELVADTRAHDVTWADFSTAHMVRLLEMYRARVADLRRDRRFRHVFVLKNHGAAWSRYAHAHSHVIATPFTPKRLEEELAGAREYHRMRERCVFCDQLTEELRTGTRSSSSTRSRGCASRWTTRRIASSYTPVRSTAATRPSSTGTGRWCRTSPTRSAWNGRRASSRTRSRRKRRRAGSSPRVRGERDAQRGSTSCSVTRRTIW